MTQKTKQMKRHPDRKRVLTFMQDQANISRVWDQYQRTWENICSSFIVYGTTVHNNLKIVSTLLQCKTQELGRCTDLARRPKTVKYLWLCSVILFSWHSANSNAPVGLSPGLGPYSAILLIHLINLFTDVSQMVSKEHARAQTTLLCVCVCKSTRSPFILRTYVPLRLRYIEKLLTKNRNKRGSRWMLLAKHITKLARNPAGRPP